MKTLRSYSRISLVALAAVALSSLPINITNAASESAAADKTAAALPVKVSFEKGDATEHGGRYRMKIANPSTEMLAVGATVLWSVQSHDRPKSNALPVHKLKPGDTWTIKGLAVGDRVTLTSKGYAPLEFTVEAMK